MDYKKYQEGKYTIIIHTDGSKRWYINGKRHRENGPAIEYDGGSKKWYIDGKLHREDGPAVEYVNGFKSWWIRGNKYSKDAYYSMMWNKLTREAKLDYIYGI